MALAAERVGERYKHSWDSKLAYDYLRARLPSSCFHGPLDNFVDTRQGLEGDNHHYYHAASAYYASGYDDAAILVVDGQGPAGDHLSTTSIWLGESGRVSLVEDINPCQGQFAETSIGHFYTAIAALAGFKGLYCEGKVMALAAYGQPSIFLHEIGKYVVPHADGLFEIDPTFTLSVLGHTLGPELYGWPEPDGDVKRRWTHLNGLRRNTGESWPTQDDMKIAYAGQHLLERILLGLAKRAHNLTNKESLCIAGGVALNCIGNEKIRRSGFFRQVYVSPAPADDGLALGKLYAILAQRKLTCPKVTSPYLGPVYEQIEILAALAQRSEDVEWIQINDVSELARITAMLLRNANVVGWFQGRSELGTRALGHRSIFADPRDEHMRDRLNSIKGREWFRPIAPAVKFESVSAYFQVTDRCPYMSFAVKVTPSAQTAIPAAIHVDGTARVQTVEESQDPLFYRLLCEFESNTGVPVLLNTSLNGRDEPIVETPDDAIECLVQLGLDALVLGNMIVRVRAKGNRV
jgi:carbamoyltransferase